MSNSLVKASLELLSYEIDVTKDKPKKKKTKSSGILDLLPINYRLTSKGKKKGSKNILQRSSKLTISEAKKRLAAKNDPTEENVKKLLLLSNNKLHPDTAEKIICRAVNKTYKKKAKEDKPKEESSVFTEEEFKKYEEEYLKS